MEAITRELRIFTMSNGQKPFSLWLNSLDERIRAVVRNRLDRVSLGSFGDTKPVGEGVHELRIHDAAGYRVYYGIDGKQILLLLCGGEKREQQKDIRNAKKYWKEYKKDKEASQRG